MSANDSTSLANKDSNVVYSYHDKKQIIQNISSIDNISEHSETNVFEYDDRLKRTLHQRHIQIIALVGVFGTGLFLSSGGTLYNVGNVGILVAYFFVGIVVSTNQVANIEISTFMAVTGGPVRHAEHFVDEAVGFALGWINVYSNIIPGELAATAVVMNYWSDLNSCVWITIFGLIIIATNSYSVRFYGEVEFVFGILKICLVFGLIITGLVINLGGVSGQERLGFRYWKQSPWKTYFADGDLGRFLAFWKTVSSVVYSFGGVQSLNIFGGETRHPRRSLYIAAKRLIIRTFSLYMAAIFVLSLIVSSNDKGIANSTGSSTGSPWVIAMKRAGISVLPHIVNAVVLTSAFSAANLGLVYSSRTLFALAAKKQAPRIFLKTNKHGVPIWGIAFSGLFIPLAYMSSSETSATVFNWFQNIISGHLLLTWIIISVNHLAMNRSLKAQGYSRDVLPYKIKGGVYFSIFSLIFSVIILLTQGFTNFLKGQFKTSSFVTTYMIIPIFIILYFGWKFSKKTKLIKPEDVDLKSLFDEIENNPEPSIRKLHGWEYLKIIWA